MEIAGFIIMIVSTLISATCDVLEIKDRKPPVIEQQETKTQELNWIHKEENKNLNWVHEVYPEDKEIIL